MQNLFDMIGTGAPAPRASDGYAPMTPTPTPELAQLPNGESALPPDMTAQLAIAQYGPQISRMLQDALAQRAAQANPYAMPAVDALAPQGPPLAPVGRDYNPWW